MKRTARNFLRSKSGASAVEFAMVLPPLLLMMLAVLEFGRLLWTREALQETAAAGARCMGMTAGSCASGGSYSSSATTTYVQGVATTWGLTLTGSNITLNSNTTCAGVTAANGFSTVTLTYTFQSVVPNEVLALQSGAPLTTTACFPNNS